MAMKKPKQVEVGQVWMMDNGGYTYMRVTKVVPRKYVQMAYCDPQYAGSYTYSHCTALLRNSYWVFVSGPQDKSEVCL